MKFFLVQLHFFQNFQGCPAKQMPSAKVTKILDRVGFPIAIIDDEVPVSIRIRFRLVFWLYLIF